MSNISNEYITKRKRLKVYLKRKNLKGVIFTRRSNYSWLTCGGRNKISDCADNGASTLLFYENKLYLFTTNIELERMKNEEINNFDFIKCLSYKWFKAEDLKNKIAKFGDLDKVRQDSLIVEGVRLLAEDFNKIKLCLTDEEKDKYIRLGKISTKCITETCKDIKTDMTEFRIQAILSDYLISEGITPLIILIGSDERLFNYRHPVPTDKKVSKYVIVVAGAMKWGLVAAITRLVHFGMPPKNILKARDMIIGIDAEMILGSRPDKKYSDIFKMAVRKYEEYGLGSEWENHHQGGPIGYEGRYFLTNSENMENIETGHAIAWNPSMSGFKSEDTFIVEEDRNTVITRGIDWPALEIETEYGKIFRPDILIK